MPTRNALLGKMTADQLRALNLKYVPLRNTIWQMGQKVDCVYFMKSGLVSSLVPMECGEPVHVWTYGGPKGMIGGHTLFHEPRSLYEYRMRIDGDGWMATRKAMLAVCAADAQLTLTFQRVSALMNIVIVLWAACSRRHNATQRLCRSLLLAREALETDHIVLTKTDLGEMVDVKRQTVYPTLAQLPPGIIHRARHYVDILDPEALEQHACPCLRNIAVMRERLFVTQ